jgi:hypothetical protein
MRAQLHNGGVETPDVRTILVAHTHVIQAA